MTAPTDLHPGQTVRVLGYYRRRRATFCLDRPPVLLEDARMVMLCGYSPREGKRGTSSAFIVRFVDQTACVEVVA